MTNASLKKVKTASSTLILWKNCALLTGTGLPSKHHFSHLFIKILMVHTWILGTESCKGSTQIANVLDIFEWYHFVFDVFWIDHYLDWIQNELYYVFLHFFLENEKFVIISWHCTSMSARFVWRQFQGCVI